MSERQKKLLVLAGTYFQIPVIEYARKSGHYVITCDNMPDNPGHKYANEYINISTTDHEKILQYSRNKNIDGIVAYGSDPAALTAAYVSERLCLPGNTTKSVSLLSDKGLFRRFLEDNGFPVTRFKLFKSLDEIKGQLIFNRKPIYIKPVDSSGSKGISKVENDSDIKEAFNHAMSFSRKREVIIEEEIEKQGPHIHGEAFVFNGEIMFMLLGDQYFSPKKVTAPMSTCVPGIFHGGIIENIRKQLSELINKTGFRIGGLNIEIINGKDNKIYFVEVGARNGGNYMPELVTMASGFKMAEANVNAALNIHIDLSFKMPVNEYFIQVILHSNYKGLYLGDNLDLFNNYLVFRSEYFSKGDQVQVYTDSRFKIGALIYHFPDVLKTMELIDFINCNPLVRLN